VEAAGRILTRARARRFHINSGGDVLLRGDTPWRVGIRHPFERDSLACVVELSHGAVATSGGYERGTHIVDPVTRRAPCGVLSVTVRPWSGWVRGVDADEPGAARTVVAELVGHLRWRDE